LPVNNYRAYDEADGYAELSNDGTPFNPTVFLPSLIWPLIALAAFRSPTFFIADGKIIIASHPGACDYFRELLHQYTGKRRRRHGRCKVVAIHVDV